MSASGREYKKVISGIAAMILKAKISNE